VRLESTRPAGPGRVAHPEPVLLESWTTWSSREPANPWGRWNVHSPESLERKGLGALRPTNWPQPRPNAGILDFVRRAASFPGASFPVCQPVPLSASIERLTRTSPPRHDAPASRPGALLLSGVRPTEERKNLRRHRRRGRAQDPPRARSRSFLKNRSSKTCGACPSRQRAPRSVLRGHDAKLNAAEPRFRAGQATRDAAMECHVRAVARLV
jgi:hypothetical protein